MKSRIIVTIGCIALGLVFSLNVRNTLDDYGILNISFVNVVWAQSSGGSGSVSASGNSPCYTEVLFTEVKTFLCKCSGNSTTPYACQSCEVPQLLSTSMHFTCFIPPDPTKSNCKEGIEKITYTYDYCCLPDGKTYDSYPRITPCGN